MVVAIVLAIAERRRLGATFRALPQGHMTALAITADSLLDLERSSIRSFVKSCAEQLTGRVLDVGCGLQPYRSIVEQAGGEYVPYDRVSYPANVSGEDVGPDCSAWTHLGFDAILSTQIIQYHEEPFELLAEFRSILHNGGHLVITGPTCWPEREPEDLFRFTQAGIGTLLRCAGFEIVRLELRAGVSVAPGFDLSLGWGALCRA